ncbi:MAG TPA: DUF6491 family protein [Caulobacteraceae bacterium]|jgi:hypothetical protein|nr:DUF6491 family protein [Caulobacteraceae bacterium]
MRNLCLTLLAAAAILPAAASAQPAKPQARQCFLSRDWRGWKAIDDKSMYIRTGLNQIYRIDFSAGCPGLTSPNAHLITTSRSDNICSALDLDIKVSDLQGFSTPCIASKLSRLTAAEMAAIPKKLAP